MNRSVSVLVCAVLALTPVARALSADDSHWGLGIGGALLQKAYTGVDSEAIPVPILLFDNRWIRLAGPSIDFKLPLDGPVSFALRAEFARDGYKASDSLALAGMAKRKDSFWYGATTSWRNDVADLSLEWVTDGSNNSDGQRAKLTLERGFEYGKFEFTPRVSAIWLSDDFVDYYYGVGATEALPSRAAYQGDSAINFEAGLRTAYNINPKQALFLDLRVEALDNVIKDSPITDESTQSSVFIGYMYMFR